MQPLHVALAVFLFVTAFNLGRFSGKQKGAEFPTGGLSRGTLRPCVRPEDGKPSKPEMHCGDERLQGLFKSQGDEDQILRTYFFPDLVSGKFLEMGGLDGVTYSNSHVFEKGLGWDGLLVEADPRDFPAIQNNRPRSMVVHAAVCEEGQTVHWTLNSAQKNLAVQGIWEFMSPDFKKGWHPGFDVSTQGLPIKCRSIGNLLRESGITHLDFFSLDVEGGELAVMQSFPFDEVTLSVFFFEADGSNSEKEQAIHELVLKNGGVFVGKKNNSKWYYFPTWLELGITPPKFTQ